MKTDAEMYEKAIAIYIKQHGINHKLLTREQEQGYENGWCAARAYYMQLIGEERKLAASPDEIRATLDEGEVTE